LKTDGASLPTTDAGSEFRWKYTRWRTKT